MAGEAQGILKGFHYIDNRDALEQNRQDKLNQINYQRGRQEKLDAQNTQLFNAKMKDLEIKQTKNMMPFYAERLKQGIDKDDLGIVNKVYQGLQLPKYTGVDVLQEVTPEDVDRMRAQGILKPGYKGDPSAQFLKGITTDKDGMHTKYFTKSSLLGMTGITKYWSDQETKEALAKLAMSKEQSVINKNNASAAKSLSGVPSDLDKRTQQALEHAKLIKANQEITKLTSDIETSKIKLSKQELDMKKQNAYAKTVNLINTGSMDLQPDDPSLKYMQKYEIEKNKNSQAYKAAESVDQTLTQIKTANRLMASIKNVKDESIWHGIERGLATYKNVFSDLSSDKKLDKKGVEKELEKRVGLNSKMSAYVASLLKIQSGTAVSEQEVARKYMEIFGGDVNHVNKQTIESAFQSHIDTLGQNALDASNSTLGDSMPVTYYRLRKKADQVVGDSLSGYKPQKHKKPLSAYMTGGM